MSKLSFDVKTYGCKVNTYDGSLLEKRLMAQGYEREKLPKVFILNTCAVTGEATLEARREARRLKRKNPNSIVVVTGCAAQVDTEQFDLKTEADLIVANSHKQDIAELIEKHLKGELNEQVFKSNIFKKEEFEPGGGVESTRTRTFLKIQDGCNSFCTYCVIPFARGKSRSLSIEDLRARVNELHSQGFNEVVLTGVHIGDYEFGLENLVEDILKNTKVPRFRLSSLEPLELSERLLDFYSDDRMCSHFHMSIQSAQDKVLKGMKRMYEAKDVEMALTWIQKKVPNAYVGMDVIVGFPGEGEEEFFETYKRLDSLPWTRIHVFPYSERPKTYALKLDEKVPQHEIHHRARRLRELSSKRFEEMARAQVGSLKQVMYLKEKAPGGVSRDYWPIEFDDSGMAPGEEKLLKISEYVPPDGSRMDGHLRAIDAELN